MGAISTKNVWVEYGSQIVLERISLEIASGAFVAIVGPSGAGKSTLLRLVLGQERPTRGTLLLDGEPLPSEPGPDRGIVFQRYSVFPHLTVLGNVLIAYPSRRRPPTAPPFRCCASRPTSSPTWARSRRIWAAGRSATIRSPRRSSPAAGDCASSTSTARGCVR
jgi:ABC-type sugar transport system ATPase subunit